MTPQESAAFAAGGAVLAIYAAKELARCIRQWREYRKPARESLVTSKDLAAAFVAEFQPELDAMRQAIGRLAASQLAARETLEELRAEIAELREVKEPQPNRTQVLANAVVERGKSSARALKISPEEIQSLWDLEVQKMEEEREHA